MSVREYIGARYIPTFSDPIQWDSTVSYEPLTVVMNEGTSYVSKQSVPAGIQITNESYWLRWADYNAQLEEYIRQVQQYNQRIQDNADDIDTINDVLPIDSFDSENTVANSIQAIEEVLPISSFDSTNTIASKFNAIEANNWVTTNRIANRNVTFDKIEKESIILIGDSWGEGYTPDGNVTSWITYVENALIKDGFNVFKHYQGGSGIAAGTTYNTQLQTLLSNMTTAQKESVKRVVFAGGWNDNNEPQADLNAGVNAIAATVAANLPNAVPMIIWIASGSYAIPGIRSAVLRISEAAKRVDEACRNAKILYYNAKNILYGVNDWATDGYHPKGYAQTCIGKFIYSLMYGMTTRVPVSFGDIPLLNSDNSNSGAVIAFSYPTDLIPGIPYTPNIFFKGTARNINASVTLNGDNAIYQFHAGNVLASSLLLENALISTQIAVLKISGMYYTIPVTVNIVKTTNDIILQIWAVSANTTHNNYMSGTLQQIEFIA